MTGGNDNWKAGDAYESFMGRWSRPLARSFISWLAPPCRAHWLDVGCGTGALTSAICELADPASVLACDPSEPFIEHARKTVLDGRVAFVVSGAEELPEGGGAMDIIVSGLVLNFVANPGRVLARMRQRLRRGGGDWPSSDVSRFEQLPDLDERTSLDGGIVGEKEVDLIKVVRFKGTESALH